MQQRLRKCTVGDLIRVLAKFPFESLIDIDGSSTIYVHTGKDSDTVEIITKGVDKDVPSYNGKYA